MNRVRNTGITHPKPRHSYQASLALKEQVDDYLDLKIAEWRKNVPFANHLEEQSVHREWYVRHMIEHVWRIRLMRASQVRILHVVAKISPEAAQLYARYQDEEMLHDTLFAQDLEKMGISQRSILETEPLFPTRLLSGFLYYIGEHENPIGAICYSYLVEYTTMKMTPKQIQAMKTSIGEEKIQGQVLHLNTDTVEDHTGDMWRILNHLIFNEEDEKTVFKYLDEIQLLLEMYFKELHRSAVLSKTRPA